jgi:hypothetical protein
LCARSILHRLKKFTEAAGAEAFFDPSRAILVSKHLLPLLENDLKIELKLSSILPE